MKFKKGDIVRIKKSACMAKGCEYSMKKCLGKKGVIVIVCEEGLYYDVHVKGIKIAWSWREKDLINVRGK